LHKGGSLPGNDSAPTAPGTAPCRIGSTRGMEVIDKLVAGDQPVKQEALLRDLCDTMLAGSLCALGGMAPFPVLSALNHFPEDFRPQPEMLEKAS